MALGHRQYGHVERGDPERPGLVVVEERLVEEDPSSRFERPEALLDQEPALLGRPVVEDVRVEMKVGCGEGIVPHVGAAGRDPVSETVVGDELLGDVADRWQVEHYRLQFRPL